MWRDFKTLARPFWTSEERRIAWGTAVLLLVIILASVGTSIALNLLQGDFFDAIQNYKLKAFMHYLSLWTAWAFLSCILYVYGSYVSMALTIRWRRWMTNYFLSRWLQNKTFYYLQISGQPTDNPDQRISEDIRDFISTNDTQSGTIPLVTGIIQSLGTLIAFVPILWKVGGNITLLHGHLVIHGYLVWGALIYAIVGSWLIARIGFPIINLNFNQQRFEADFRFSLVRLRENSEGIALSNGEMEEKSGLMNRFSNIFQNYYGIMNRTKKINAFSIGYQQAANVFPFFLAAPAYFAHRMTLGGLIKTSNSFGNVQGAVSYFISVYTSIASWRAVIQRLAGFVRAMETAQELAAQPQVTRPDSGRGGVLTVRDLTLSLPNGEPLFSKMNLEMEPGRTTLISGPSGSGKSTLLRTIAGIWPYAKGDIRLPKDFQPMILPQRPYLPVGTLRAALAYPSEATAYSENAIQAALKRVRLPLLANRLDEAENWALMLSPGEQQRVALARAFLQQPQWLFLDEATSALDEPTEAALYQEIAEALPNATVVSIGHRSTLHALHDVSHVLDVETSPVPVPA